MKIIEQDFLWTYDEALSYMAESFSEVKLHPEKIFVASGSHSQKVITLGRNPEKNVLGSIPDDILVRQIERGGGITAHEPGQIVLYPVMNIEHHKITAADLMAVSQQAMVDFLGDLGLIAQIDQGIYFTGQKLGFLGFRIKEGITSHGISLNLFNDAKIFSLFDPCGMKGLPVTSVGFHLQLFGDINSYARRLRGYFVSELNKFCSRTDSKHVDVI